MPSNPPDVRVRSFFRSVAWAAQELSQLLDRSVFVQSRGRNSSFANFQREFDQIMAPYLDQRSSLVYALQEARRTAMHSHAIILKGIWEPATHPQRAAINHLYSACWEMGFDLHGNTFISVRPDANSGAFARDPAKVQQIKAALQQAVTAARRIGSGQTPLNGLGGLGIETDPTKMTPAEYAALLELQKKSQELVDSMEIKSNSEPWTWGNSSFIEKAIIISAGVATVLALISGGSRSSPRTAP